MGHGSPADPLGDGNSFQSHEVSSQVKNPAVTTFVPPDGPARWTKVLLIATLLMSVIAIVSGLLRIELLSRAATPGTSQAEVAANNSSQLTIETLQDMVTLGTVVAFLIWFHRVHRNLPSLGGRELRFTPWSAVIGFILPLFNFVIPLWVMREVWYASDPSGFARDATPSGPSIRNQLRTPPLIAWWWAFFLMANLLGNITNLASYQHQTPGLSRGLTGLRALSDVLKVPTFVLTIRLIGRITEWQTQRRYTVNEFAGEVATAPAHIAPSRP